MKIKYLFIIGLLFSLFSLVACSDKVNNNSEKNGEEDSGSSGDYVTSEFWEGLPFQEYLPLEEGPLLIDGEEKEIKIGFSQTGFDHPWRVEMIESAQAEVDRYPNVSLVVTDGNVDVVKQSSDVDDLIAQEVDAIVLSPIESDALVNATNRAIEAGIPVIVLDRDVFTEKSLFIGQSNFTLGQRVAEVLVEKLGGKGNVLEITGMLGASAAIDRGAGFASVIEQYPDINLLQQGDGRFVREPAVKLMEDWLTAYGEGEIDAVYSHAEESSWGAVLAIERAGRSDEGIMHFTMDGSSEGFRSVQSGEFEADGNYTPFIGQLGVRAALYKLMDKEIEEEVDYEYGKEIILPDLPVVVKENADEWVDKGWGD